MKHKAKGFTLIELMIAISIVAILASIALFDMGTMRSKSKGESFSQEFKHLIKFARSKAMTTGDPVVVCALNAASGSASCVGNWHNGTISAFSDIDGSADQKFNDAVDVKLRSMHKLTDTEKLVNLSGVTLLRFNAQGTLNNGLGGAFVYCPDTSNKHNVEFELTAAGLIREKGETTKTCN